MGELLLMARVSASSLRLQVVKSKTYQWSKIAVSLEPCLTIVIEFVPGTATGNNLTIIRFPRWEKRMNYTNTFTKRTG